MPRWVHLAALAAYCLATVVLTLPLTLRLGDSLVATDRSALSDAYLTVWIFARGAHQLLTDPLQLFEGNIFYPFAHTLAFSEIILPGTLLYLPFAYATGNPVFAHNLVVLLSFPLNAMAMYFYALDWLADQRPNDGPAPGDPRRAASAFVAGLVFAFCTYKMGELRHVQLLMAMFIPLTLWSLARFLRTGRWRDAAWAAICFALNALSSLYYGLFLAVGVAAYLAVDGARRGWRYSRTHVRNGLLAAALSGALVLPFAGPYVGLEGSCQASETRDPRLFSARPASYVATPPAQWLYGKLTRKLYVAAKGQPLFPGAVALTLAAFGVAASLREASRAWVFPLALVVTGFVLSFGPVLLLDRATTPPALPVGLPYGFLSTIVPPLKCLGAPARFAVLSMAGLSLLAAKGLDAMMVRRVSQRWAVAAVLTAIAILSEYGVAPVRLQQVATAETLPEVYRFLASRPPGEPVVEMPMGAPTYGAQNGNAVYTYYSVYHQQPLVNGYSGFIPPEYYALVRDMQAFPSAAAVERLDRWGVEWIVVHADRYRDAEGLRRRLDSLSSVELVRDFGSIWLYRIRRAGV